MLPAARPPAEPARARKRALRAVPEPPAPPPPTEEVGLRRRPMRHDIHHQLGPAMTLAPAPAGADDVGPASRTRSERILGAAPRRDQLPGASDGLPARPAAAPTRPERL